MSCLVIDDRVRARRQQDKVTHINEQGEAEVQESSGESQGHADAGADADEDAAQLMGHALGLDEDSCLLQSRFILINTMTR